MGSTKRVPFSDATNMTGLWRERSEPVKTRIALPGHSNKKNSWVSRAPISYQEFHHSRGFPKRVRSICWKPRTPTDFDQECLPPAWMRKSTGQSRSLMLWVLFRKEDQQKGTPPTWAQSICTRPLDSLLTPGPGSLGQAGVEGLSLRSVSGVCTPPTRHRQKQKQTQTHNV